MVGDALVNSANQMGAGGVIQFEAEIPLDIGLGTGGFFHALGQLD